MHEGDAPSNTKRDRSLLAQVAPCIVDRFVSLCKRLVSLCSFCFPLPIDLTRLDLDKLLAIEEEPGQITTERTASVKHPDRVLLVAYCGWVFCVRMTADNVDRFFPSISPEDTVLVRELALMRIAVLIDIARSDELFWRLENERLGWLTTCVNDESVVVDSDLGRETIEPDKIARVELVVYGALVIR